MKLLATALKFLPLISAQSNALTDEQSRPKSRAYIYLYSQYKSISAIESLQTAAEGDDEAPYYLGEAPRKNRHMTPEAKKAYESSAKRGISTHDSASGWEIDNYVSNADD